MKKYLLLLLFPLSVNAAGPSGLGGTPLSPVGSATTISNIISGSFIATGSGTGTNNILLDPVFQGATTLGESNIFSITNLAGTPAARYVLGTNSRGFYVFGFGQTKDDMNFGSFWLNPFHDAADGTSLPSPGNSEWQITAPHNMALIPGYINRENGRIQIGNPDPLAASGWRSGTDARTNWAGMFFQPITSIFDNTTVSADGWSLFLTMQAGMRSNNVAVQHHVGMFGFGHTNKGMVELNVATDFGAGSDGVGFDSDFVSHPGLVTYAARFQQERETGNRRILLMGTLAQERVITVDGSVGFSSFTNVLDFGKAKTIDMLCSSTNLSLATTNWTAGNWAGVNSGALSAYENHVVYIRGMIGTNNPATITVRLNPNWNTNGLAATYVFTPGNMLRLELESVGLGETNVQVASAQILSDHNSIVEPEVATFMGATGLTDMITTNALNVYTKLLKSDGTWNRWDVIYPFVGTTSNTCSFNLKDTTKFRIAWPVPAGVTFAGGITGNGSTGYGITSWTNTQQLSGSFFAWTKGMKNGAAGKMLGVEFNVNPNQAFMLGNSSSAASSAGLWINSDVVGSGLALNGLSQQTNGFAATRSGTNTTQFFEGYQNAYPVIDTVSTFNIGTYPVYLLAANFVPNIPFDFWDKTLQAVALGTNSIVKMNYQTTYMATTNLNAALSRN